MGDRFYAQQKAHKPRRVLKKDVIARLERVLNGNKVEGLDRLTIKTLNELTDTIIGTFGLGYDDYE